MGIEFFKFLLDHRHSAKKVDSHTNSKRRQNADGKMLANLPPNGVGPLTGDDRTVPLWPVAKASETGES